MIVGNGLLAKAFAPVFAQRSDVLIFASGVSNSREDDPAAFERERLLLLEHAGRAGRVVYFGTCSVYDTELKDTPYVTHKLQMEEIVLAERQNCVFRLPQVVGVTTNKNTLINFIYRKLVSGEEFCVWKHARRNIIDVDDVLRLASAIIDDSAHFGRLVNIASPKAERVENLVRSMERILGIVGRYESCDAGCGYDIDVPEVLSLAPRLGIDFSEGYADRVLCKYYCRSQVTGR